MESTPTVFSPGRRGLQPRWLEFALGKRAYGYCCFVGMASLYALRISPPGRRGLQPRWLEFALGKRAYVSSLLRLSYRVLL